MVTAHIMLQNPHPQTGSQLAMGSGHRLAVSPKENEGVLERIIWEASRGCHGGEKARADEVLPEAPQ